MPMANNGNEFDEQIAAHLDEWLARLARLCAQPSLSAQNVGVRECAGLVADMLREEGFSAEVMETAGQPVVYGEMGQGERTMLLYNHYDVQPPEPLELWETPPFEPSRRDGKLFARGVADDKGHIISRLAALQAYCAVVGEPPFRVKFIIEGEEEIGSPSLDEFVRDHQKLLAADGCIWESGAVDYDGRPEIVLGNRGILSVDLRVRTAKQDAHSGGKSFLENAAWRMVWALASLKDQHEHIRIPGFYDDALAPSERQQELLAVVPSSEDDERAYFGVDRFVAGWTGDVWKAYTFSPTCTINGLDSGYQGPGSKTVIPAEAKAKLDFRLVPNQDPDDLKRKLRAHLDANGFDDVEITRADGERPGVVDPDDPFVRLAIDTAREVYGKEPVVKPLSGGTGPVAPFIDYLHVPIGRCGIGYPGTRVHSPNEHIRIDDFVLGTRHMTRILAGFAEM